MSSVQNIEPLEQLALSIGCYSAETIMAFFDSYASYNDAAGGDDHGFIVVSGWVSSLTNWLSFLGGWRTVLAEYHVPYFHMKEFSQSKGPFASWKGNEEKRARFLSSLVGVIKSNVEYGASSVVDYKLYDNVNRRYYLREACGTPYAFAARSCMAHIQGYLREKHGGKLPDVRHVFEDGDKGKGELMRVVEKDGYAIPSFLPSRDRRAKDGSIVRGLVQLQAADFAAYEMRKAYTDDPNEEWMPWEHRKSLQALGTIECWWGHWTVKNMVDACKKANIRPRLGVAKSRSKK